MIFEGGVWSKVMFFPWDNSEMVFFLSEISLVFQLKHQHFLSTENVWGFLGLACMGLCVGSNVLSFGDGGRSENAKDIDSCITSFCVCTSPSVKEKTET